MLILRECIEDIYTEKENRWWQSNKLQKAYDSVKRETMVEIITELKIASKIIDFIVNIYREDSTKIQLEESKEIEIEVTSGRRHGCTGSIMLFKKITHKIMEEMRKPAAIKIKGTSRIKEKTVITLLI